MNYTSKIALVKSLNTPPNTSMRYDCCFCGGRNTLGVTNRSGKLLWRCYRASCDSRGVAEVSITASQLLASKAPALPTKFILPSYLTYVTNESALSWLSRWHCTWAISNGHAEVRYDPKENRVVFLMRDTDGVVIDAAGRALGHGAYKWKKYGNSGLPLTIGKGTTAYICEDAASACALAHFGAGVALLGTHITDTAIGVLRGFERCVVCLDPDAKLKALAMQRRVSMYVSTRVVFLQDDPKAYDEVQLGKVLGLD